MEPEMSYMCAYRQHRWHRHSTKPASRQTPASCVRISSSSSSTVDDGSQYWAATESDAAPPSSLIIGGYLYRSWYDDGLLQLDP